MNFKKAIAAVAAAALALSAMSFGTSAAAADGIMDFEDGVLSTAISKITPDMPGDSDAAQTELSIADYNGSKMLKMAILDGTTKVGKVRFDMKALFGADIEKINSIKVDLYVESADGASPTNWAGGWLRSSEYNEDGTEFTGSTTSQWEGGTYSAEDGFATPLIEHELKWLLPTKKYKADAPESYFDILKFAQGAAPDAQNVYIDNIEFLDADGNGVPFAGGAAAPAADAAADTTTAPATGNAPIAIAAALVVVAGVGMIATRKRK
jgi:hypothetical protein